VSDPATRKQPEAPQSERKPASPLRAISAVLGAFVGIRKSADRDADLASLKPVHVIVAGVIGAVIFVTVIVTLVRLIAR
jgi:hypothetical protein